MAWSGKTGQVYVKFCDQNQITGNWYEISADDILVAEVTAWDAEFTSNVAQFGSSDSEGWMTACNGTNSVSGTIEVKSQLTWNLSAGLAVSLILSNAAVQFEGNAMIVGNAVSTKIDGGEPVSQTYRFVGNGPWTAGDGTADAA
jgi:hypothetical protein